MVLLTAILSGCAAPLVPHEDPIRQTQQGPVRGLHEGGMIAFRGIPYAAAPTGERRFAPPEAPPGRQHTLNARNFGSVCPQPGGPFGTASTDEDCLYLNIYTPAEGGQHPVMVWLHGGAFVAGSGGATYNATRLVSHDVVLVTLNYRLGTLGFLAHAALSSEAGGGSGDYGLMDQQQALRWVRENIASFGGDPGNITLFGESAGGDSVLAQLASPTARGLFHRAIVQSGSYSSRERTLAEAEAAGARFAADVGCPDSGGTLACLRALSVEKILAAPTPKGTRNSLTPNLHPQLLPRSIAAVLASGSFNRVPVLTGNNHNEFALFIALDELANLKASGERKPLSAAEAQRTLVSMLAPSLGAAAAAAKANELYPPQDYPTPSNRLAAAVGDSVFHCPALEQARELSRHTPTHAYQFADGQAPNVLAPFKPSFAMGASHTFEVPYLLSDIQTLQKQGVTPAQIALAESMVSAWVAFARTEKPGAAGTGTPWPAFKAGARETLRRFDTKAPALMPSSDFVREHRCDFWTG